MDYRAVRDTLAGIKYGKGYVSVNTMTESQYASYAAYNSSLQVQILRQGPIVGTSIALWYSNEVNRRAITTAKLDDNRSIRCYQKYQFTITYRPAHNHDLFYTKCIQVGRGWGNDTNAAMFSINATSEAASENQTITARIFSSDRVAYLAHGRLPAAVPKACISNGQVPHGVDCSVLFEATDDSTIANRTRHVTTMELTTKSIHKKECVLTVDHVAYLGFTNYSFDISAMTNPAYQIQTLNTPSLGQAVPVHPFWTLSAWSVDNNGYLATNRFLAVLLSDITISWANGNKKDPAPLRSGFGGQIELTAFVFIPVYHTISLLGFRSSNTTSATDPSAHILSRYARRYVWSYGMFSTSARLSAAVMICGVIVVIVQFIFRLRDWRQSMNLTELVQSALAHHPGHNSDNGTPGQDEPVSDRIRITPSRRSGVLVHFEEVNH